MKIRVEISAVKGDMDYVWYKVKKRVVELPLRGKVIDLNPGDIIGLRPSTNGKSTRMVFRGKLGTVYSPDANQVKKITLRSEPLIGGPVDNKKIGHLEEPKVGVKERRIKEELENLTHVIKRGADIADIRLVNNKLFFTYKNRGYTIVPNSEY